MAVYGNGLGASQAGPMHEVWTRKASQAEYEVPGVHQEARERAGWLVLCGGSEELEEEPVSSSLPCGLRAHWMHTWARAELLLQVIHRAVAMGTDAQRLVLARW